MPARSINNPGLAIAMAQIYDQLTTPERGADIPEMALGYGLWGKWVLYTAQHA